MSLSVDLNVVSVPASLIVTGRLFHNGGPATEKAVDHLARGCTAVLSKNGEPIRKAAHYRNPHETLLRRVL